MAINPEDSIACGRWREWPKSAPPVELWTRGDFVIDHVSWLDSTIRNSGWIEVLAASHDGYLDEIANSLEAIGAHDTLDLLKKCVACFPGGKLADNWLERSRQIESLGPQQLGRMEDLDEEYYASPEDICEMAMNYWDKARCDVASGD